MRGCSLEDIWYIIISDIFKFSCIHILALQGQCLDLFILILTDNGLVCVVSLNLDLS